MKNVAWLAALAFVSCNNATKQTSTTDKARDADTQTITYNRTQSNNSNALAGCYLAVSGRDTIRLQLNVQDSAVTGRMQYDNFEVDGNMGTIQGVVRNGTIKGYFRFFSEGMWSVREVVFKEQNGKLLQANTAKMNYHKDTALFAGPIIFDGQRPFSRVACSELRLPQLPQ